MQESQVLYRTSRPQFYVNEETQGDTSISTTRAIPNPRSRRSFEEVQFDVFRHNKNLTLGGRNLCLKELVKNSGNPERLTTRINDEGNLLSDKYSRVTVNSHSLPTSAPKFGVVMDVFSVLMIVTVGFVMVF